MDKENMNNERKENIFFELKRLESSVNDIGIFELLPSLVSSDRPHIDLSQWTLLVNDRSLKQLGKYHHAYNNDLGHKKVKQQKTVPSARLTKIRSLDLSGADRITDYGLKHIVQLSSLERIRLDNAYQITEIGLQYLVQSCGRNLIELSLSGCRGISGPGFFILGAQNNNTSLRILKLSRCNQIQTSTFGNIIDGCRNLEVLDVSHCNDITDNELRLLAKNCPISLRELNLKECSQISDLGISSLLSFCSPSSTLVSTSSSSNGRVDTIPKKVDQQGCQNLTVLDLGRSQLIFKITDLALLSLSERCKSLSHVSFNGCEMITDTGISWLVQGCKQLTYLDLTNCSEVTDSGMNSIGNGCPKLRQLIISRLKRVTDVGIRYVVKKCHLLENINASGLFRLSDGVKRDFGYEGIPALGKSKCASTLVSLNLHGCFQISSSALKYVSLLKQLETLVLSGCTNLTYKGMALVAESCVKIKTLSLGSCGNCVTDAMVTKITKHMTHISDMNLSRCERIGRVSMTSLSHHCKGLRRLDLTGCKGLSDTSIVPLCESSTFYPPGINALYLSSCPKITNLGLEWIADGFNTYDHDSNGGSTMSLITLSMKGTKVTYDALVSVRDRFVLSEMKKSDSFFGFYPLPRASDRKAIDFYAKRFCAATKIQAWFRGVLDVRIRCIPKLLKMNFCKLKTAIRMQSLYRGIQARCYFQKHIVERLQTELRTCIRIQSWFRCFKARQTLRYLQHMNWLSNASIAAIKVQSYFRGNEGRRISNVKKNERIALEKQKKLSCIKIQSIVRMFSAKCEHKCVFNLKVALDELRCQSSIVIQCCWRIYCARKEINFRFEKLRQYHRKLYESSNVIQRCYHCHFFRILMEKRIQETRNKRMKATIIQCFWRTAVSSGKFKELRYAYIKKLHKASATLIQCQLRRFASVLKLEKLKEQAHFNLLVRVAKKRLLSRWWKLCLAKLEASSIREKQRQYITDLIRLEIRQSTKIAAVWRGKKDRDRVRSMLLSGGKASRWKQIWSEEYNRYFYYNKFTGESRWRKPQALLDLEPRPRCSNCHGYFEAKVECANCEEFFCYQCWDSVHYGGKRVLHQFRSLYDFYGRRIDYGEGSEFPSCWPTEIEQDERNDGDWRLRVNPLREPSYVSGDWEVYEDSQTNRKFYYNSQTHDSSYFPPTT